MSTLELLIVHDYMIVYFHSAMSSRRKLPGLRWFKRCYDMIDRRWACFSAIQIGIYLYLYFIYCRQYSTLLVGRQEEHPAYKNEW